MAKTVMTQWGVVVILTHQEVLDLDIVLVNGRDVTGWLAERLPGIAGWILKGLTLYIRAEIEIIKAVDKGNGVYLTMLYVTPGLVVPTTRPDGIGIPAGWVTAGSGRFTTENPGDLVEFRVEPDAVAPDIVDFVLESYNPNIHTKTLVLRDGEGGNWDITIDPAGGKFAASNALWAYQVKNGQQLSLFKSLPPFWIMHWVLDIGELENIQPGSRVVFTWVREE